MPTLERLFAYDAWANAESLKAVRDAGAPAAAVRLMAHIAAAEQLWKGRLQADPAPVVVWPESSVDAIAARLDRLGGPVADVRGRPRRRRARRSVAYVNSKGESWTTSVEDILLHVVLHSAYHRGQVAYVLRAGGAAPPYTDYAHCIRTGLIRSRAGPWLHHTKGPGDPPFATSASIAATASSTPSREVSTAWAASA